MNSGFTFGMEMEVNVNKRGAILEQFNWVTKRGRENNVIHEWLTLPCAGHEFLRRITLLGHILGFQHERGEHHRKAESFHLHIGRRQTTPSYYGNLTRLKIKDLEKLTPLLMAAHHMSRTGTTWRTKLDDFAGSSVYKRKEMYVGRGSWITNNHLGTIEVRMNENPSPLIPVILLPVLVQNALGIDNSTLTHALPEQMAQKVRGMVGEAQFTRTIDKAKRYWHNQTVSKLLDAFVDGATTVETWQLAHTEYSAHNRQYGTAFNNLRLSGV